MKISRRLNWPVFLFLFVFLSGSAFSAETPIISLKIIHINDLHGHIQPEADKAAPGMMSGGAVYLGAMVLREKAADPEGWILLAAGDMFQGTPVSNVFRGKPVTEIMNYLGFDAMVLGNHEFDWGQETLQEITKRSAFPVLGANILLPGGKPLPGTRKYIILERKGLKIAVIGIITPDTALTTKPENVKGLSFTEPERVLPGLIREAREKGAALVIVLSHCGLERDRKIAALVAGIDVIVGGHSHTAIEPPCLAGNTIIVQAGWAGKYLGVLDIQYDAQSGKISGYTAKGELKPVVEEKGLSPDAKIEKIIESFDKQIRGEFSRIVGETSVELTRSYVEESNLGDLICDAIREAAAADIAFQNSGGIRADIPRGKITLNQVFQVLPFDNQLISMDLTGRQITAALERSAAGEHGILQVSGLKVTVDVKAPPGSRIKQVIVAGRKIEPDQHYRVAVNDFLAAGGDRMTIFSRGTRITYGDDLREIFVKYLKVHSPLNHKVEGRIIIER